MRVENPIQKEGAGPLAFMCGGRRPNVIGTGGTKGSDVCNHALMVFPGHLIELAAINLIDNAFKYAKEGGSVEVSVGAAESAVTIRVRDHGPGIEPDDRERIFERFVRGKNASERQVRGSGIGLALVKHIAESHGGSVTVESAPPGEKGCCFVLTLPALAEEPKPKEPPGPPEVHAQAAE